MPRIETTPDQLPRVLEDIRKEIEHRMDMAQREALSEMANFTHQEMKRNAPRAEGILQNQMFKRVTYGQEMSVATVGTDTVIPGAPLGYGEAVEKGVGAHRAFPPYVPGTRLWRWVRLKITSDFYEATQVAKRVAAKIYRTGIKPKFFAKKTFELLVSETPNILRRVYTKFLKF